LITAKQIVELLNAVHPYAESFAAADDYTITVTFRQNMSLTTAQLLAIVLAIAGDTPDKVTESDTAITLTWNPPG
jgi:hypothetical protein